MKYGRSNLNFIELNLVWQCHYFISRITIISYLDAIEFVSRHNERNQLNEYVPLKKALHTLYSLYR